MLPWQRHTCHLNYQNMIVYSLTDVWQNLVTQGWVVFEKWWMRCRYQKLYSATLKKRLTNDDDDDDDDNVDDDDDDKWLLVNFMLNIICRGRVGIQLYILLVAIETRNSSVLMDHLTLESRVTWCFPLYQTTSTYLPCPSCHLYFCHGLNGNNLYQFSFALVQPLTCPFHSCDEFRLR